MADAVAAEVRAFLGPIVCGRRVRFAGEAGAHIDLSPDWLWRSDRLLAVAVHEGLHGEAGHCPLVRIDRQRGVQGLLPYRLGATVRLDVGLLVGFGEFLATGGLLNHAIDRLFESVPNREGREAVVEMEREFVYPMAFMYAFEERGCAGPYTTTSPKSADAAGS